VLARQENAREHLDGPVPWADREASLADIHRLNTWFGGYRLSERAIERLIDAAPPGAPVRIIDVGGGRGDLATRLIARARRRGRQLAAIVVDRDGVVSPRPGLAAVRADARALPFRPGAADVVTASLLLHHLEPAAAARSLAEMRAAARRGVVINDLLRSRMTLGLVWVVTRLFTRHPFARHDGPLSVRRAYSPQELRAIAARAGVRRLDVRRYPWLGRIVAVAP
jgi:ubiquinone/menaquinone biosynthesis C-methylase UbiE